MNNKNSTSEKFNTALFTVESMSMPPELEWSLKEIEKL